MKSLAWLVALVVLAAAPIHAAEKFTHPAYAWSITPPDGFAVRAFVDELSTPFYILTPDAGDNPAAITRGQWIYAVPIPTDDQLDPNTITPLITGLIVAREPGLKIGEARTPVKLGGLDAIMMSVEGRRAVAGAWKGELIVAVQEDNFIVVSQGGPPEQFAELKAKFDTALKTFVAPLPIKPISEPAAGAKLLSEDEAKLLLKKCTPMVRALGRRDVKDEDTLDTEAGTGTAFLMHPDGWAITNRHVVESISGVTPSGQSVARLCYDKVELHFDKSLNIKPVVADVVAVSYAWDLALLKIRGEQKWPAVPLADPSRVKAGHKVLVAGWPEPEKYGKDNVTIAPGKVLSTDVDVRGRHMRLRHDAFTRPGSSGGPIFDLDLGEIVAAHYAAFSQKIKVNGVAQELPGAFKGGVPVSRLLWEFPHIAAHWSDLAKGIDQRRALVAYYLLQERFGAAFIEANKALAEKPDDGLTNAYAYRMYAMQNDTERAQDCLKAARKKPESSFAVVLLAAQTALENGDTIAAHTWVAQAYQTGGPTNPLAMFQQLKVQIASGGQTHQMIPMTQAAFGNIPNPELEMLRGVAGITQYIDTYNVHRLPPRNPAPQQMIIDSSLALEKSIELWPARNGLSWAHLALVHAVDGRKKKAEDCRAKALLVSPRDPFVRLTVAQLDLMNGNFERARAEIGQANEMRTTAFGLFLTGWANLLEARQLALAKQLQPARQLAAQGTAQIHAATGGQARQAWWRSYAADVSSNVLR